MKKNYPNGDVWELKEKSELSVHKGRIFKFDFNYITNKNIKDLVKSYVWNKWKTGDKTLSSLYKNLSEFKRFIKFSEQQNIHSLRELTNNHIDLFLTYLNTSISELTKKTFSYENKKKTLDNLKGIIRYGQLYFPNQVPQTEIFTGNEFPGTNKKLKIDFIPDDVVIQIEHALKFEENPYIKYGFIILKETGMRISELRNLKINYIQRHQIHGWELSRIDSKTQKMITKPINVECLQAFKQLEKHTKILRKEADEELKEFLFLHNPVHGKKTNQVVVPSVWFFQSWFKSFIKRHHIIDSNNELYPLTSHQFRRTLATDMISSGADLNVVQDTLGHSYASTTWLSYADVKDKERAEIFNTVGIIGNINMVDETLIPNQKELQWFQENYNKGARLSDGYCTKPFEGEDICQTFLKRQKCFGCTRFVTTPEYLDHLKLYLADLENELEANSSYGQHYANHITPTIDALKEIIYRLEELKNGYLEVASTESE